MTWLYIVEAQNGKYYTGITEDLERRMQEHREGRGKGSKFLKAWGFKALVYVEEHPEKGAARRREIAVKKLNPESKKALINRNKRVEAVKKMQYFFDWFRGRGLLPVEWDEYVTPEWNKIKEAI